MDPKPQQRDQLANPIQRNGAVIRDEHADRGRQRNNAERRDHDVTVHCIGPNTAGSRPDATLLEEINYQGGVWKTSRDGTTFPGAAYYRRG